MDRVHHIRPHCILDHKSLLQIEKSAREDRNEVAGKLFTVPLNLVKVNDYIGHRTKRTIIFFSVIIAGHLS